jgi:hypothetical protein
VAKGAAGRFVPIVSISSPVGCCAAFVAWGSLQNLFGYRDSPVFTYLLLGLPWLALAVGAFVVLWRLLS